MTARIALVVMFLLGLGTARSAPLPAKTQGPNLPSELSKAWQEAGAEAGLMETSPFRFVAFVQETESTEVIPAFRFTGRKWNPGIVQKLPRPKVAFGLELRFVNLEDANLKDLADLGPLQALSIEYMYGQRTRITDAGLKELARLRSLKSLTLQNVTITEAGLREVGMIKSLRSLRLFNNKVPAGCIDHLDGLEALQALDYCNPTTDADLKGIGRLKTLQSLDLRGANVTDAGLKHLTGLTSLQSLDLRGTKVTDAGLRQLAVIKSLKSLDLDFTAVSTTGVEEFRKASPNCEVSGPD